MGLIDISRLIGFLNGSLLVNNKIKLTKEGGIATRYYNKTGAPSIKGTAVKAINSPGLSDAIGISEIDTYSTIGFIYEDGIADGSLVWVVYSGIAEILLEDGIAATAGQWVRSSVTQAGRALTQAAPPPPPSFDDHFQEYGHILETKNAGVNVLVRAQLHLL